MHQRESRNIEQKSEITFYFRFACCGNTSTVAKRRHKDEQDTEDLKQQNCQMLALDGGLVLRTLLPDLRNPYRGKSIEDAGQAQERHPRAAFEKSADIHHSPS